MDAVDLLKTDHRLVEGLFTQLSGTRDREARKTLFTKIVEELSAHASVEEQVLYPTLRKLQKTDKLADHSIHEHQEMKETLEKLRHVDVLDPAFDVDFNKLVLSVTHHVQEEESLVFTELRGRMTADDLRQMGQLIEGLKKVAPTRPHPGAPNTQPLASVTHPIAAFIDKIGKAVTGSA